MLHITLFGVISQTYLCYFHSSITPRSKGIGKNCFALVYNGSGQKLTWPEVTWEIRDVCFVGIRARLVPLKVQIIGAKTVHRAIMNFDVVVEVMFRTWPDLVTWPLESRTSKFAHKMCFWILSRYAKYGGLHADVFKIVGQIGGEQILHPICFFFTLFVTYLFSEFPIDMAETGETQI